MKARILFSLVGVCILILLAGCMQPNSSPVARFTRSPSSGEAPLFVTFNATSSSDSDGYIVSYSWAFGDGTSGTGVTASHTYSVAGSYSVTLTVRDEDGAIDTVTYTVTAREPSTPTEPTPGVDYSVTAGQILDEFDANEVAATLKYQGKRVAVTGYVDSVSMSVTGEPYVTLERSPGFWLSWVFCDFPVSAMPSLASLAEGDHVTIVGDFDDCFAGSVWLENCQLP